MRLFIAFDVPSEPLVKLQKELDFKGVRKVNYFHCTLKFLGDVEDENVDEVRNRLRRVVFKPINANFDKIGFFPNENYARVIWVGLKPEDEICLLQKKVGEALEGLFVDDKRFLPHVTIARVSSDEDKNKIIDKVKRFIVDDRSFKIDGISLMRSELKREGAVYTAVDRYDFR